MSDPVSEHAPKTRLIAVLGEMRELGDEAPVHHYSVGKEAGSQGIDVVIAVGDANAKQLALGAAEAGVSQVAICSDKDTATELLKGTVQPGDIVLVKGANGAQLWTIGQAMIDM